MERGIVMDSAKKLRSSGVVTDSAKKKKKMGGREWQWVQMSILPVLHTFIFSYCTLYGLLIAFKDYKYSRGIWGSKWVGFDNFKFFVLSNDCARLVRNTLSLNLLFIATLMIAEIALAIVFYELTSRKALKSYQTILITPNFISWVTIGYVVYAFLQPQYGIINNLLKSLGMQGIQFYNTPAVWPGILNFANVWKNVGMGCIIYYATLMGIDASLYEAARIDGASKWQEIKYVTLPMLTRLIVLQLIMAIGGIFSSDFGLFYQLTRDSGALYSTTDVIDTYLYRTMRVIGDMKLSSAVGFLKAVVGFVLVYITNFVIRKIDDDLSLF